MDVIARQRALEALAGRLHDIGPGGWVRLFAAFETHPDGSDLTWAIVGAVNLGDRWGFGQLDQDPQTHDLALAFRAASEPAWTSCELTVDRAADFSVELGYDGTAPAGQFSPAVLDRLQSFPETFQQDFGAPPHA